MILPAAAAAAAKNNKAVSNNEQVLGFSQEKICVNKLSFKKRKNKSIVVVYDDLEDTAIFLANSPKVCNLMSKYLDKRPDQKNTMDISQEENKGSSSARMEERNGVDSVNGRDNNINDDDNETELKKRGLCLVPLSMIIDYLD